VIDTLKKIIADATDLPAAEIGDGAGMETIEAWDSLAQMNICLSIQERFGVAMDMDEIAEITTFEKIVKFISERI
jgi:acyl carrier protein